MNIDENFNYCYFTIEYYTNGTVCARQRKEICDQNRVSGALRNAKDLINLLEGDKVSIVCSEKNYGWESHRARASTSPDRKIKIPPVQHPFISFNPFIPVIAGSPREHEIRELKTTHFHEQLHNLGYMHGHSIEYPYACEDCCFLNNGASKKLKEKACKICSGNYDNSADIRYVEELIEYDQMKKQEILGLASGAAILYSKNNPGNIQGISMIALANSGINPIGFHLAGIIQDRNKKLDSKTKKNLERAREYHIDEGEKTGKILAQVYYELYFNQDGLKAVETLEKNKEKILAEILSLENDSKYIGLTIRNRLDAAVLELALNWNDEAIKGRGLSLFSFFKTD